MDGDHVSPALEVDGCASEGTSRPLGGGDVFCCKTIEGNISGGHSSPVNFSAIDPDDAAVVMADVEDDLVRDLASRNGERFPRENGGVVRCGRPRHAVEHGVTSHSSAVADGGAATEPCVVVEREGSPSGHRS